MSYPDNSSKDTILYVDDEPTNRLLVEKAMGEFYKIKTFNGGSQFFESNYSESDLVLLDVQMPGKNGYEVCAEMRKCGYEKPILFLSCFTSINDRLMGYEAGGNDYLFKPFDLEELKFKISSNIQNYREKEILKVQLVDANKFAYSTLTNAGELGQVVQFVNTSYVSQSLDDLATVIKETLGVYGLNAVFRLQIENDTRFYSLQDSVINNLEKELLLSYESANKISSFQHRCLLSSRECSLLIKNMPDDEEKAGRFRDHLASVLDAACQQVRFLKSQQKRKESLNEFLNGLRNKTSDLVYNIDNVTSDARNRLDTTMNTIKSEFLDLEFKFDLDANTRQELKDLSTDFQQSLDNVYESFQNIEDQVNALVRTIETFKDEK